MANNNKAHIKMTHGHKSQMATCAPATSLSLYSRYFAMLLGLAILWLCTLQSPALKDALTTAATELFMGSANAMGNAPTDLSNDNIQQKLDEPIACGPATEDERPSENPDPDQMEMIMQLYSQMGEKNPEYRGLLQSLQSPLVNNMKKKNRGETLSREELLQDRATMKQFMLYMVKINPIVVKNTSNTSTISEMSLMSKLGAPDFANAIQSDITAQGLTLNAADQKIVDDALAEIRKVNTEIQACPAPITCAPLTASELGLPERLQPGDPVPALNPNTLLLAKTFLFNWFGKATTPFDNQTMRLYLAQKKILEEGGIDVDVLADNIKKFKEDDIESNEFLNKINTAYGTNDFADALKSAIGEFEKTPDALKLSDEQKTALPGIYQQLRDLNFATCDGQVMACGPFTVDQFNKLNKTTLAFKPGDTSDPDLGIFLGNLDTNAKNFGLSPLNTLLFKRWAQNKLDNADHQKFQLLFTQISILQRWVVLGALTQNNQLTPTLGNQISATMGTQGLGKTLKENVTLSALPPIPRMGIQQAIRELDSLQMPYCPATISCEPLTKDEINRAFDNGGVSFESNKKVPEVMTFEPGEGTTEQLTALDKAIDEKFKGGPGNPAPATYTALLSKMNGALKREARGTATPEDHGFLRLYKKQMMASLVILTTAPEKVKAAKGEVLTTASEKVKAAKGEVAYNQFIGDLFNDIGTVQYPNSLAATLVTYGFKVADYQSSLTKLRDIQMNPTCPPPPAVEQKVNLMLEVLQKDPISCADFTTSEKGIINPTKSTQTAEQENMALIYAQLVASVAKPDSLSMIGQNTKAKLKAGTATAVDAQTWRVYNQLVTGGTLFETKINEGNAADALSRWSYTFALADNRDDYLKSMQAAIARHSKDLTQDQITTLNGIISRLITQTTTTCREGVLSGPVPTLTPKPIGCAPLTKGEILFTDKVNDNQYKTKDAEIDASSSEFNEKAKAIQKRMIRGQDTPADRAFFRLYGLDLVFSQGMAMLILDPSSWLTPKQFTERVEKNKLKNSGGSFFETTEYLSTVGTDAFPDAFATAFTNTFKPLSPDEQGRLARAVAYLKTIKIDPACGAVPDVAKPAPVTPPVVAPAPVPPVAAPVVASKPAPKPVAKPAPKPVAKPAPKPVAKPAPKPVAKPAVAASSCPMLSREDIFRALSTTIAATNPPKVGSPESAYAAFDKRVNLPYNRNNSYAGRTGYDLLKRAARGIPLTPAENKALSKNLKLCL